MSELRVSARAGVAVAAVFAASVMSGAALAADPDLNGIYWITKYNAKVDLVGGGELPLTAMGKEAYEKNMKGLKDGSIPTTRAASACPMGRCARSPTPTRSRSSRRRPVR